MQIDLDKYCKERASIGTQQATAMGRTEPVTDEVRRWLDDGGVPITHEVVQGALSAMTFLAMRVPLDVTAGPIAEAARAFAELGEEYGVTSTAHAVGC